MTQAERAELERWIEMIYEKALEMGLDPFPVHFEVVPAHVIYELGAYALPARFSHWTFGRDYHVQKTMYEYGVSRIYELVFNSDPAQAFLLDVNDMLAHKLVIAHVYGHSDFFKNNIYFEHTDRKMIERARLHAERIREYEMHHGPLVVEQFLDAVLSIEEHIDPVLPTYGAPPRKQEEPERKPTGDTYEDIFYMVQPKPKPEPKKRKIPEEPQKDLLLFIRDHSRVLEDWQRDIISMIREEMIYFLPQIKTKIINEGWACATGDSLLFTEQGIVRYDELYAQRMAAWVATGEPFSSQPIKDYHRALDVPTIRITTKRGYTIEGAQEHRVLLRDGRWAYLKDVRVGDEVQLALGAEVWSQSYQPLPASATPSATVADVARAVGVSYATVMRYLRGRKVLKAAEIAEAFKQYQVPAEYRGRVLPSRRRLNLPDHLNEDLAYLLGYFIGDGNFIKSGIGFTTGDLEIVEKLNELLRALGCEPKVKYDTQGNSARWRVAVHSRELRELLIQLGMRPKQKAREKSIPPIVLRSPREVVASFLRGYFDADAYAGKSGVILSSASESLIRTVQVVLINFGVLSTLTPPQQGVYQLGIRGASAQVFAHNIGFSLKRKQEGLRRYIEERQWFCKQEPYDVITQIEHGRADVYDITVAKAHRYVANGMIHHNSFWHERILEDLPLTPDEHVQFRRMHSSVIQPGSRTSINPYYVGYKVLRDIERRWNGEIDPDEEETDWMGYRIERPVGQGMQKLFEVRTLECDQTFLHKYLTEKLVRELDLYTYRVEEHNGELVWVIDETDWRKVRNTLVDNMTNFGMPVLTVEDGDWEHRGELYLKHHYDGKPLDMQRTTRCMRYLVKLWGRPVHIETVVDDEQVLITCDGNTIMQRAL
ncbi:MAG: SpoVR family protein [Fimbriimonadales bacterium]|nr:SpoVR family protein [Fimbriimonadales bacterium]